MHSSSSSSGTRPSRAPILTDSGLAFRPPPPDSHTDSENEDDRIDNDVESEDEMDVGSAGRKRRAGKQKETRAKRPREEPYAPRGLQPLRAPFHEDLPAKQQMVDYRLYRQPGNEVAEHKALRRISHHHIGRRAVPTTSEYYDDYKDRRSPEDVLKALGLPLDGFVKAPKSDDAALRFRVLGFTSSERHIVASANTSYIPYLPDPDQRSYRVRMRADLRFGAEDLTLVPTYYMPSHAPHLACIPRRPLAPRHPENLMWASDVAAWFDEVEVSFSPSSGMFVLKEPVYKELKKLVAPLCKQADKYLARCRAQNVQPIAWARGLEISLSHTLGRLKTVPVTRERAPYMAREVQRLWLELTGMMNFISDVQPILVGTADPPEVYSVRWYIGAATTDIAHAQHLHRAGVPVWAVQRFDYMMVDKIKSKDKVGVPYAASLRQMFSPDEMANTARHPDNLPYIFEGLPTHPLRLQRLHQYSTVRVAITSPREQDLLDVDPLIFNSARQVKHTSSTLHPLDRLKQLPGPPTPTSAPGEPPSEVSQQQPPPVRPEYLQEVDDEQPPLMARNEKQHQLPAVDFDHYGAPEDDVQQSEELPAEITVRQDSPPLQPAQMPSAAPVESAAGDKGLEGSVPKPFPPRSHAEVSTEVSTPGPAARWPAARAPTARAPKPPPPPPRTRHPKLDKPSCTRFWEHEISRWSPSWSSEAGKGDGNRAFPLPDIITGRETDEKCAFYMQAWLQLRPFLVMNARRSYRDASSFLQHGAGQHTLPPEFWTPAFPQGHPLALSSGDWKQLLFARVTMREGSRQSAVHFISRCIQELFPPSFDFHLFIAALHSPYTVRGEVMAPGVLPPPRVMKDILLDLQELIFRQDFIDLDRRLRACFYSQAEELWRLRHVFDPETWDGVDLLNLTEPLPANRGLASEDWRERSKYVKALAKVMMSWEPPLPARVAVYVSSKSLSWPEMEWFERQTIAYYVRNLWYVWKRETVPPPRRSTAAE